MSEEACEGGSRLDFRKLSGDGDLAVRHGEGVLAVALVGQLELIAAGVLDSEAIQLVALIRGHGDGHPVALGGVLGADGHIAVLGAGCGYSVAAAGTGGRAAGGAAAGTGRMIALFRSFECEGQILTPLDKTGLILVYGKNIGITADFIHRAICPVLCQTQ